MTVHICPQCGNALSSDAPQRLCPECLLKAALLGQTALESSAPNGGDTLPPKAIAPGPGVHVKYFGDYELLEEIARGGMGVVWKARQTRLNRVVALKMIRSGTLASKIEVDRFLREAEAAANLQHPNIVAIHEIGEHAGQHYFSMDYVAGRDLGTIVKDGPLSAQVAARHVKIIAEAIHYAHQRGTLHRDLKPQNVLIDAADQPRITDFGLAKLMNSDSGLTQTGVVMGSPSYMPPEQAGGRQVDIGPASDVYSIGAMLYELLTGRAPFRGNTPMATVLEVLEAEPAALRTLKADIPPDLETICLKCLEKSPTARYPTARALAEELDRFLKGDPILARPASAVRKTVSWARRHPRTLAALVALVMVALALGIFYLFEENAFLRAQQVDPALARLPGPRHESLKQWLIINFCAAFAGVFTLLALESRRRGLPSKDRFDVLMLCRPLQPLGEWTRTLAIGAGLMLVGCGVAVLVKLIQAFVWEGAPSHFVSAGERAESFIFAVCVMSCLSIEFGIFTLIAVIQDYRLVNYGISNTLIESSRPLTAEEIEPIRDALEDDDWIAAVNRYREAVPNAGYTEAIQYVARLRELLWTQHPDRNDPPPLSLAAILKEMLIGTLWPAFFLGCVFWFFMKPASDLLWIVSKCACGLLIGMGLTAVRTRVKSFWKRILLLVPALVLVTVTEGIRSWLCDPSTRSVWPYLLGSVYGGVLMAFGFKPKPKRTKSEKVM